MVFRAYVEKREGYAVYADSLLAEIKGFLKIHGISRLRVMNRYDVEEIDETLFNLAKENVFAEPQVDKIFDFLPDADYALAIESLPGQFNQRADSAAQCIQLIGGGEKPIVRSAQILLFYGELREGEFDKIKRYLINPVETREADLNDRKTLAENLGQPEKTSTVSGFRELDRLGCEKFLKENSLAMDVHDLELCRDYFCEESRDPTITEIKVLDTYWSDHCRHTTFNTRITEVSFEDNAAKRVCEHYLKIKEEIDDKKPVSLMNLATIAAKYLKSKGLLKNLDESEEVNACTVRIKIEVDGTPEDYLLFFKNETHNHPTEIEPFGGAATCIGGAIRDPLSGRSYVYQAMRVSGAGDPTAPIEATLKGKLPQRTIAVSAANGYSSYGNQIGLATGQVSEIYHEGFLAKRLELGAVLGAAPLKNVVRKTPEPGDAVILLGGRTGRDGCGGATGSSKMHTEESVVLCSSEVQKGNAPEERKLQRFFRNEAVSRMIKRCNDFGAGGVSVAVGELADGLIIDLDAVPKKYDGLTVTELAISESQERMAVVVDKNDAERFILEAKKENLEATVIAKVTAEKRLVMTSGGVAYVNISREFLNTNGAPKYARVKVKEPAQNKPAKDGQGFKERFVETIGNINCASQRGLAERFCSTIGSGTVVMPFGGKNQLTPAQAMVAKIPTLGETDDCTVFAYGYNPFVSSLDPFAGGYIAVVESLSKLIAQGADIKNAYLTFQEYFEMLRNVPERWGKPFAALLGALKAQLDFNVAAVGGKDSMSGSFNDIDVPPTLVSFAVAAAKTNDIITAEFKGCGNEVILIEPTYGERNMPVSESLLSVFERVQKLIKSKRAKAVYTTLFGGVAEAVYKCCIGNGFGFKFSESIPDGMFDYRAGRFIIELDGENNNEGVLIGEVIGAQKVILGQTEINMSELDSPYNERLSSVYPVTARTDKKPAPVISHNSGVCAKGASVGRPRALITVFPGTNCEYDIERSFRLAGANISTFVMKNLTPKDISESVAEFTKMLSNNQILFIPGGFSAGDEPEGSGKFIAAFFKNPFVSEAVTQFLEKQYLFGGICNGFQALIKLGLLPYGKITAVTPDCPTLSFNSIGRHQSRIVRTRVASNKSPWLRYTNVGDVFSEPVSHGEGRFIISQNQLEALINNGQIATQYCDLDGIPSNDILHNPNGSYYAIEGITSPDGRIFGKMAHSERTGRGLYKNVEGRYGNRMFEAATEYFK